MSLLVQITDTHILPPGELLYGSTDTAAHLADAVQQVNAMRPKPDAVLITGDLTDASDKAAYRYFIDLIDPLEMPAFVIPGNHDHPGQMAVAFAGTPYFPATDPTFQYVIDDFPIRIIALNSHSDDFELPEFDDDRLAWLEEQLKHSDKPVLIAIHHPPMTTGIELIDMAGSEWFQGLKSLLSEHPQVRLLICGHCHADVSGRIGNVPVYMASATAHQLIAARGQDIAPSFIDAAAAPVLHQYINGDFLSGSYPWPANVDENRIDKKSGESWEALKNSMKGQP